MTWEIRQGDSLAVLRSMPAESVHCCVTSPPYWGLRDYGVSGQMGLEPTMHEYVAGMREVFEEVRRVLRGDGTLWLNLGDSYAGSWGAQSREHAGKHAPNVSAISANQVKAAGIKKSETGSLGRTPGLKPKDLCGIPWRVAFALQDAGWWLRRDIIWHKPNPMPESTRDRCTSAHEYLFHMSKSARYWYDAEAIAEPAKSRARSQKMPDGWDTGKGAHGKFHRNGREKGKQRGHGRRHAGFNDRWDSMTRAEQMAVGANKRSVWTVATMPFKEAHFATMPPSLVEPCILAGCPPGGVVLDPFAGSGTTGMVALRHGRNFIGIELNPEYCKMARRRIEEDCPLFNVGGAS